MPDENQLLIEIQGKDEASDQFDRLIGRAEKAAASFKSLEKALIPTESRLKELGKVDFQRVFSGLSEVRGSLQSLPVLDLKPLDTSQSVEALQNLTNTTAIASDQARRLSSNLASAKLVDTSSSVSAISSLNEQLEIATDSLNQKISANIETIDTSGSVKSIKALGAEVAGLKNQLRSGVRIEPLDTSESTQAVQELTQGIVRLEDTAGSLKSELSNLSIDTSSSLSSIEQLKGEMTSVVDLVKTGLKFTPAAGFVTAFEAITEATKEATFEDVIASATHLDRAFNVLKVGAADGLNLEEIATSAENLDQSLERLTGNTKNFNFAGATKSVGHFNKALATFQKNKAKGHIMALAAASDSLNLAFDELTGRAEMYEKAADSVAIETAALNKSLDATSAGLNATSASLNTTSANLSVFGTGVSAAIGITNTLLNALQAFSQTSIALRLPSTAGLETGLMGVSAQLTQVNAQLMGLTTATAAAQANGLLPLLGSLRAIPPAAVRSSKVMYELNKALVTTAIRSAGDLAFTLFDTQKNAVKLATDQILKSVQALWRNPALRAIPNQILENFENYQSAVVAAINGIRTFIDSTFIKFEEFEDKINQSARQLQTLINPLSEVTVDLKAPSFSAFNDAIASQIAKIESQSLNFDGAVSSDSLAVFNRLLPSIRTVQEEAGGINQGLTELGTLSSKVAVTAGALGLELENAGEAIAQILQGSVDTENVLARSLGINSRNLQIWESQGAILDNLNERLSAFNALTAGGGDSITTAIQKIRDLVDKSSRELGRLMSAPILIALPQIYDTLANIQQRTMSVFESIFDGSTDLIGSFLDSAGNDLKVTFDELLEVVSITAEAFSTGFAKAAENFVSLSKVLSPLVNTFAQIIASIGQFAAALRETPIGQMVISAFAFNVALSAAIGSASLLLGTMMKFTGVAALLGLLKNTLKLFFLQKYITGFIGQLRAGGDASLTLIQRIRALGPQLLLLRTNFLAQAAAARAAVVSILAAGRAALVLDSGFVPFIRSLFSAVRAMAVTQAGMAALTRVSSKMFESLIEFPAIGAIFLVVAAEIRSSFSKISEAANKTTKELTQSLDRINRDLDRLRARSEVSISIVTTSDRSRLLREVQEQQGIFSKFMDSVRKGINATLDAINPAISKLFDAIPEGLNRILPIFDQFKTAFSFVKDIRLTTAEQQKLNEKIIEYGNLIDNTESAIKRLSTAEVQRLKEIQASQGIVTKVFEGLRAVVNAVLGLISQGFSLIPEQFKGMIEQALSYFSPLTEAVKAFSDLVLESGKLATQSQAQLNAEMVDYANASQVAANQLKELKLETGEIRKLEALRASLVNQRLAAENAGNKQAVRDIDRRIEKVDEELELRKELIAETIEGIKKLKPVTDLQIKDQQNLLTLLEDYQDQINELKDVSVDAVELPDLGSAYEQLREQAANLEKQITRNTGNQEEYNKAAKDLIAVTRQQLELGAISLEQANKRYQLLAQNAALEADVQIEAQKFLTELVEKERDRQLEIIQAKQAEVEAIAARGEISEAQKERRLSNIKKVELEERLKAVEKAAEAEKAIAQASLARDLGAVDEEIAQTDDGEQKKALLAQRAAIEESYRQQQQIRDRAFNLQRLALEKEVAIAESAEAQRRNAERLKDYEEAQKVLKSQLDKRFISRKWFNQQSTRLQQEALQVEQQQLKQALEKLAQTDVAGREVILSKIAEIESRKVQILEESYKNQAEAIARSTEDNISQLQQEESNARAELRALYKEGELTAAEFDAARLQSTRERLDAEIAAEMAKIEQLKAIDIDSPEVNAQRQEEIAKLETEIARQKFDAINTLHDESMANYESRELEAIASLEQAYASGAISKEKLEEQKKALNQKRIDAEIDAERQKLTALEALEGQIADPDRERERLAAIRDSRDNLNRLAISAAQAIQESQEQLEEAGEKTLAVYDGLNTQLDKVVAANQLIEKSLERQELLAKARQDLEKANLDSVGSQIGAIASLERSDFNRQRLAKITAAIKLRSLQQEIENSQRTLEIDIKRRNLALQSEQAQGIKEVLEAQAQLLEAAASEEANPALVQAAQLKLAAAQQQVLITKRKIAQQPEIDELRRSQFQTESKSKLARGLAESVQALPPGQRFQEGKRLQEAIAKDLGFGSLSGLLGRGSDRSGREIREALLEFRKEGFRGLEFGGRQTDAAPTPSLLPTSPSKSSSLVAPRSPSVRPVVPIPPPSSRGLPPSQLNLILGTLQKAGKASSSSTTSKSITQTINLNVSATGGSRELGQEIGSSIEDKLSEILKAAKQELDSGF